MTQEDYCSYEVAKLLKENGFNYFCFYGWDEQLFDKNYPRNFSLGFDNKEHWISCPTHQMAMKWLREAYRIDIVIEIFDPSVKNRKYYCMIWDGNNNSYILDLFNSYEEAVEATLKYCIENLI